MARKRIPASHAERLMDRALRGVAPNASTRALPPERPARGRIFRAANWFLPLTEIGSIFTGLRRQTTHLLGQFDARPQPQASEATEATADAPQLLAAARRQRWIAIAFCLVALAFAVVVALSPTWLGRLNATMSTLLAAALALYNALLGLQYRHAARGQRYTRRQIIRDPALWN